MQCLSARCDARGMRSRQQYLAPAVLVLALLQWDAACAFAAGIVQIGTMVGFNDTFVPERWTPLRVTLANRDGALSGELEVRVSGGDPLRGRPFVTIHRRAIDLDRHSRKSFQFTVFLQRLSEPVVIRVTSEGREVARADINLHAPFTAGRLILVLSRDANLDFLNDGAADGVRVLYPHPELLPAHWRGYDAVAAIVVSGVSLERLSERQFEALHKWIAQGGALAVSGGVDYTLLRSPRLAALLPGVPSGMRRMDAAVLRQAFSDSLDLSRPVHVNRLEAFRGRATLRAGDAALIVERSLGRGRVLFLTFDVTAHPFNRWDGMRSLLNDSLALRVVTNVPAGNTLADIESPLPSLVQDPSTDFPSHMALILFLVLYLGLLLAGNRMSLRGKAQRWIGSFVSWAAPLLFAPAAWVLFGPSAFPRGATMVTMATIEPLVDSIYARLRLDVGLYANRSGTARLAYRGAEPVLYPPRALQREGRAADWILGEGSQPYIEPVDRRRYVLHQLEGDDVIAFYVVAAVFDAPGGPRVVLENASGRPLKDLWLVVDGFAYALHAVAAGARIERRLDRRAHGVAVGEASWQRIVRPTGTMTERMVVPARIALERHVQRAGAGVYPAPGHALLVGYTDNPLRPAGASAGWPHREQALVVFEAPVRPAAASQKARDAGAPAAAAVTPARQASARDREDDAR